MSDASRSPSPRSSWHAGVPGEPVAAGHPRVRHHDHAGDGHAPDCAPESERYPEEAADYVDEVATISNIALLLLFLSSLGQNLRGLLDMLGSGAILATLLLAAVAIVGGYLLAIPAGVERRLLSIGTAQRNLAAAFIIAAGNFVDRPTVLTFLATAGLILIVVLFPLAGEWAKRPSRFDVEEGRAKTTEERLART